MAVSAPLGDAKTFAEAFAFLRCRSSSVVEHTIGNGEVGSSILPCGTSFPYKISDLPISLAVNVVKC